MPFQADTFAGIYRVAKIIIIDDGRFSILFVACMHDQQDPKITQMEDAMRFIFPLFLLFTGLTVACDDDVTAPEPETGIADVLDLATGTPIPDAFSELDRNGNVLDAVLQTGGLLSDHAYTMWMVVFNDPSACEETTCGVPDVAPGTDALVDLLFITGTVADEDGLVTFSGQRTIGDNSRSVFASLGAPAPGLIDPDVAQIFLVIRFHGPFTSGSTFDQIRTYEGGCTPESSLGLGIGTIDCEDVQISIHQP